MLAAAAERLAAEDAQVSRQLPAPRSVAQLLGDERARLAALVHREEQRLYDAHSLVAPVSRRQAE